MQTIRRAIISDEAVIDTLANLRELPKRIEAAKNAVADLEFQLKVDQSVQLAKENLDVIEKEVMFEVQNETGDDGKKRFTNEAQRAAAAKIACSKNKEWQKAVERVGQAERQRADLDLQFAKARNSLSYLYEEMRANTAIAYCIGGLSREEEEVELHQTIQHHEKSLADLRDEALTFASRISGQKEETTDGF